MLLIFKYKWEIGWHGHQSKPEISEYVGVYFPTTLPFPALRIQLQQQS